MQVAAGWIMLFALDHLALEHVHVLAGRVRVDVWPAAAGRHLHDPRAHAGGAGQVAATATGADLDRRDVRGDQRQHFTGDRGHRACTDGSSPAACRTARISTPGNARMPASPLVPFPSCTGANTRW